MPFLLGRLFLGPRSSLDRVKTAQKLRLFGGPNGNRKRRGGPRQKVFDSIWKGVQKGVPLVPKGGSLSIWKRRCVSFPSGFRKSFCRVWCRDASGFWVQVSPEDGLCGGKKGSEYLLRWRHCKHLDVPLQLLHLSRTARVRPNGTHLGGLLQPWLPQPPESCNSFQQLNDVLV